MDSQPLNDPKHQRRAREIAARYGATPFEWRILKDGSFSVLFNDGRKVNSEHLPPATHKDQAEKPEKAKQEKAKPSKNDRSDAPGIPSPDA